MKALVQVKDNKVIEITEVPFEFHAGIGYWVDCDSSVKVDQYYIENQFKETNLSDADYLQFLKDEKIQQIKELRDFTIGEPTPKDGSAISYQINGESVVFKIDFSDLGAIIGIISILNRKKAGIIAEATKAALEISDDKESPEYLEAYKKSYEQAVITDGLTRGWSDVNGVRYELTEELFQSLHDHILDRDNTQRGLYFKRKKAINALKTIKKVKAYDINTIYEI
jgi:hypothetical protein